MYYRTIEILLPLQCDGRSVNIYRANWFAISKHLQVEHIASTCRMLQLLVRSEWLAGQLTACTCLPVVQVCEDTSVMCLGREWTTANVSTINVWLVPSCESTNQATCEKTFMHNCAQTVSMHMVKHATPVSIVEHCTTGLRKATWSMSIYIYIYIYIYIERERERGRDHVVSNECYGTVFNECPLRGTCYKVTSILRNGFCKTI